ncbi:hypothetical protein [Kaistella palustris]|uniref:hypothetical protein n=1 Tax=Kaistella palustris TaxID=493376 RepID=UPI000484200A|nr:hypothetical protein [Kaistella palustris]
MNRLICTLLLLMLLSCKKWDQHPYTFYYWRTNLSMSAHEKKTLAEADAPYLYTRFFDIEKVNGKFQPVAVITKDDTFQTDKEIVPVVFIKNDLFYDITLKEIDFLAKNVSTLIQKKQKDFGFKPSGEIQIDCDWTAGTNKEYFAFLEKLKDYSKKEITCPLRLHQVKDRTLSGVPPVDKVYLMCYSTSSPLENTDRNSILDMPTLKNYLRYIQRYPLDIDVAVPIFSWGIVTNHVGKHKLINALTTKDLQNPNFKMISENKAEVLKDGFYFGSYLSKGFTIKVEEISNAQIRELKQFIGGKLWNYNIVYYHLDGRFLNHYNF